MGEPAAGSGKNSEVWEYYEKIKNAPKQNASCVTKNCQIVDGQQISVIT